jgi:hypothetical protein
MQILFIPVFEMKQGAPIIKSQRSIRPILVNFYYAEENICCCRNRLPGTPVN